MASAFRVSRSIRRWSSLCALPFLAALALAACGGKVVVDSGEGGAGGGTASSASVTPSTGSVQQSVCDAAIAHLNTCTPGGIGPVEPLPPCDGQFLCQMQCILAASCGSFDGSDPEGAMQFVSCANTCA
jgi:hypothetical protein